MQITKRIYIFSLLLIIVPATIITLITEYQYYRYSLAERQETLFALTKVLDRHLEGSFTDILRRENALNQPKQRKIEIINAALQPEIDAITAAYPGIGAGFYSRELKSRVAIGPNLTPDKLVDIPANSPYLSVYRTGKPLVQKTFSTLIWNNEPILAVAAPIYRNNKLIGHLFVNTRIRDLYVQIMIETAIIIGAVLIVAIVACRMAWWFLRRLRNELEMLSVAVTQVNSGEITQILPELNPVIDLVHQRTTDLQSVIDQLRAEVSMREAVEAELLAANEKATKILERMTGAYYALDKKWKISYANSEAEYQISMNRNELIGKDIREIYPYGEIIFCELRKAMEEQKTVHFQKYFEKTDRWFDIMAYPSEEGLGVYLWDITERKKANERIVFQANILKHVRNAIIATDLEGKITHCNSFAEKLYMWKAEEVIGKDCSIIPLMPESSRISSPAVKASLTAKGYWEGRSEVVRKDGVVVPVHRIVTLIKKSDGTPTGIISVGIDLTEIQKFEKELARLDQLHMVGEMAAGIGHEVRNPMTTVRGFMQLLSFNEDNPRKREQFSLMIEELDRANSIITEYLSLAKNKKVELKPHSLNAVIKNLLPLLQADAMVSDKYIKLETQDIPDLALDEKELSQLIINLVRNGLEAMAPGGIVSIRTYKEAGFTVLSVKDEGTGIDPEIIKKLGTPFVTTKESGTGLGLAVTYSIADRHNARIDFETSHEGTTFFVRFSEGAEDLIV